MAKEKGHKEKEEQDDIYPLVDKYHLLVKLKSLTGESGKIAVYIDNNIQYGRALGYAEGRNAAFSEIMNRILDGEFDPYTEGECEDEYEM